MMVIKYLKKDIFWKTIKTIDFLKNILLWNHSVRKKSDFGTHNTTLKVTTVLLTNNI